MYVIYFNPNIKHFIGLRYTPTIQLFKVVKS